MTLRVSSPLLVRLLCRCVLVTTLGLSACGTEDAGSSGRPNPSRADSHASLDVRVVNPESLGAIETPFVDLVLSVKRRERVRIARVVVNGIPASPAQGRHMAETYHVRIPTAQPGGHIRVVCQPSAYTKQEASVFCFPYACTVAQEVIARRRMLIEDVLSLDEQRMASAILRLEREPSVAEVPQLADLMLSTPSPRLRLVLARLMAKWQALGAVDPMLQLLTSESDQSRRAEIESLICAILGYAMDESDNPCSLGANGTHEGEKWLREWFQGRRDKLQAERFPESCN